MKDWPPAVSPQYPIAVFLDRDGTINADTHFPHQVGDLNLLPGAADGLALLAELPVHIIVISNQAGIALGMFRREDMSRFNAELRRQVARFGGRIDAFYFCPHREPKHLRAGEEPCACSKPAPGLILEAAQDFHLALSECVFIGDRPSDVEAGRAAGCTTILLGNGDETNARPDHVASTLSEAALLVAQSVVPAAGRTR